MALIDNLTDKACIKNKSGPSGSVLYGQKDNKSKGSDKDKGKKGKDKEDRAPCWYYSIPGTKYKPKDYLAINKKKYKE